MPIADPQPPSQAPTVPARITLGGPWPADKYTKLSRIGRGAFGEAWIARSKPLGGKLCVCKEVNVSQMSERERQDALNEVRIIRSLTHPNIVRLYDWFVYSKYLVMVMEYADGGDMSRRIRTYKERGQKIKEETMLNWLVQMLLALAYLHSKRVLHRDMKAENVFITSKNIVKLGDFGISTVLRHTMAKAVTVCGTPYYFSPEICNHQPYNNKSDVWGVGVLLYEMCALRKPFEGRNLQELMRAINRGRYLSVPAGYSSALNDLLGRMLTVSPTTRLTVPQVLRIPLVREALTKWENSQECEMKVNQPGLPPGHGFQAVQARLEAQKGTETKDDPVDAPLPDPGADKAPLGGLMVLERPGEAKARLDIQRVKAEQARAELQDLQKRFEDRDAVFRQRQALAGVAPPAMPRPIDGKENRAAAALRPPVGKGDQDAMNYLRQLADRKAAERKNGAPTKPMKQLFPDADRDRLARDADAEYSNLHADIRGHIAEMLRRKENPERDAEIFGDVEPPFVLPVVGGR